VAGTGSAFRLSIFCPALEGIRVGLTPIPGFGWCVIKEEATFRKHQQRRLSGTEWPLGLLI
jgi:hypothetical protein